MTIATIPTASGVTPVNGIALAWQSFGGGGPAPLVVLHGGYGTIEMFGANVDALAAGRRVVGVDLQSHGRSPATDRPMRFETMADDVAALIEALDLGRPDVFGFSLGGGVALRLAIQHPAMVRRLVLVSTPFKRSGWHPEMVAAMEAMGPEVAPFLRQTPLGATYADVAPRPDDWPILVAEVTTLLKDDYDWTAEARDLEPETMLVAGDADGLGPRHAVEFFELLGGGLRDAVWDRSGMTRHRLAILPGVTHYDISVAPALGSAVASFLDEPAADMQP